MNNKVELTEVKDWVVVEREKWEPHYFDTFEEALKSPIKGHVMTKTYYDLHYSIEKKD